MTGNDNSGAAFPCSGYDGMTLRDYFAARFMERAQSLCETADCWNMDTAAQGAYAMADAMLEAREA